MAKLSKDEKAAEKTAKQLTKQATKDAEKAAKQEAKSGIASLGVAYPTASGLSSGLPLVASGLSPAANGLMIGQTTATETTDYSNYIMYGAIGLGAFLLFRILRK